MGTVTDDTLFDSQNAAYAQAMFEEFARNPEGVPAEWRRLFENGAELAVSEGLLVPEQMDGIRTATAAAPPPPQPVAAPPAASPVPDKADADSQALLTLLPQVRRATALVQAFRDHGHQLARIDPLGSEPPGHQAGGECTAGTGSRAAGGR